MTTTRYQELQTEKTTLEIRISEINNELTSDPVEAMAQRFAVELPPEVVNGQGYTDRNLVINGVPTPAYASIASQVNPDAQHVGNGRYELSSPVESAPTPVHVEFEDLSTQDFEWTAIQSPATELLP